MRNHVPPGPAMPLQSWALGEPHHEIPSTPYLKVVPPFWCESSTSPSTPPRFEPKLQRPHSSDCIIQPALSTYALATSPKDLSISIVLTHDTRGLHHTFETSHGGIKPNNVAGSNSTHIRTLYLASRASARTKTQNAVLQNCPGMGRPV